MQQAIASLRTAEDVMAFFDRYIEYGSIDVDGNRLMNSLGGSDFRTKYRTTSLETSLSEQIGACIEQTNITRYLLMQMHIPCKTFCTRGYNADHPAPHDLYLVHCWTLAYIGENIVCIEHSDTEKQGIYVYETEVEAKSAVHQIFSDKFRHHGAVETTLVEYHDFVPGGLSFNEFNEWMNNNAIN